MHNIHCEKTCNRIYSKLDDLEWKSVRLNISSQISFDVTELGKKEDGTPLDDGEDEWKTYFHFLRADDGSMGLLMTVLQSVEPIEPIPLYMYGWYHKLVWYSKHLGRFVSDQELQLKVTLHHQERKIETAVLDFTEGHIDDHMDTTLDGISLDESCWTFLSLGRNKHRKPMLADLELVKVVPKRKRVEEEETHTSRKKSKKE